MFYSPGSFLDDPLIWLDVLDPAGVVPDDILMKDLADSYNLPVHRVLLEVLI